MLRCPSCKSRVKAGETECDICGIDLRNQPAVALLTPPVHAATPAAPVKSAQVTQAAHTEKAVVPPPTQITSVQAMLPMKPSVKAKPKRLPKPTGVTVKTPGPRGSSRRVRVQDGRLSMPGSERRIDLLPVLMGFVALVFVVGLFAFAAMRNQPKTTAQSAQATVAGTANAIVDGVTPESRVTVAFAQVAPTDTPLPLPTQAPSATSAPTETAIPTEVLATVVANAENSQAGQDGQQVVHIVRAGETCLSIARKYGIKLADFVAANKLNVNACLIRVDDRLIVPGLVIVTPTPLPTPELTSADVATAVVTVSVTAVLTSTIETQGQTYVVRTGDTCYVIAQRFGVNVADLAALNKLRLNYCLIRQGDILKVPARPTPKP